MLKKNDISTILKENTYPGRGIIIGKTADGTKAVFAYFIMGRSQNSRNRVFVEKKNEVTIYPFDNALVSDPSLIIYSPIRQINNYTIVTNGDQTDTIHSFIAKKATFEDALATREFEPDMPNFTPRISGIINFGDKDFDYKLSILKCGDNEGKVCNRYFYNYTPVNGVGHLIHTYKCDGQPIPSFEGEPQIITINDDVDTFANTIWNSLNADNKVSLYVRYTDLNNGSMQTRLFNKNN
ncbi:MAG TPA: IMP cyclohydrolase [Clostridia bacterium]|nr:IMP cyclohydrolase [Clostridia bacterium]